MLQPGLQEDEAHGGAEAHAAQAGCMAVWRACRGDWWVVVLLFAHLGLRIKEKVCEGASGHL